MRDTELDLEIKVGKTVNPALDTSDESVGIIQKVRPYETGDIYYILKLAPEGHYEIYCIRTLTVPKNQIDVRTRYNVGSREIVETVRFTRKSSGWQANRTVDESVVAGFKKVYSPDSYEGSAFDKFLTESGGSIPQKSFFNQRNQLTSLLTSLYSKMQRSKINIF